MEEGYKTGDMFIDVSGGMYKDGCSYKWGKLFEFDINLEKGYGRIYTDTGEPTYYAWAWPKEDCKVENIPDDVLFSFKHGIREFYIKDEDFENAETPLDVIKKSDFKIIDKNTVEENEIIYSIDTIEDVRKHWELIKKRGFTLNIANICWNHVGVKINEPTNGEIGIHAFQVVSRLMANIDVIENAIFIDNP